MIISLIFLEPLKISFFSENSTEGVFGKLLCVNVPLTYRLIKEDFPTPSKPTTAHLYM
jgi:hypothetical protein